MLGGGLANAMGRGSVNFESGGDAALVIFALSIAEAANAAPHPALAVRNCLLVNIVIFFFGVWIRRACTSFF
jgi:hypothetical protein